MIKTHNLGFPRIGAKRELKFSLESFWQGETSEIHLEADGKQLRQKHWQQQASLDFIPVGDFSFYDQVLDASFLIGNIPSRVEDAQLSELEKYFRIARGRAKNSDCCAGIHAGEMTKWFDTNYHYIVPEISLTTEFSLNPQRLLNQLKEAEKNGIQSKPVLIGPVTYLWLCKTKDGSDKLENLDALVEKILPVYSELLTLLSEQGIDWVQLDEPILVTEISPQWCEVLEKCYQRLQEAPIKILLATYFGTLQENLSLTCNLPVAGLHLDAINALSEVNEACNILPKDKILSLGVINGRNVWKTDLNTTLDWLEPIANRLKKRLWIAPSCSLLHVPVDLDSEVQLDSEIKPWLAFASQKLHEITLLAKALNNGRESIRNELNDNQNALNSRRASLRVHNPKVILACKNISTQLGQRTSIFSERIVQQQKILQLPKFPTTTIGSFPQTQDIRKIRRNFKAGDINQQEYTSKMQQQIQYAITEQESLGLDVLVHGEPERNDMVEYFSEQLEGYIFSQFGWVQSYGSRCVKPPIIFGDIQRPNAITVEWSQYAQSLTNKKMKGMLTGPVTMLNWSFVRDDQSRQETCNQLALALREEVIELEQAGIQIIQIDEAALREGLPLRKQQWKAYLDWAIEAFRICANGVKDETQIHTHMCYSEFNDIIASIADMDADVITIETSRSDMELLAAFENFAYPNDIGPGVYDIHSPNIPSTQQIVDLMLKASERIPAERLWINPDCGLKTRAWKEVIPALKNMQKAAEILRQNSVFDLEEAS